MLIIITSICVINYLVICSNICKLSLRNENINKIKNIRKIKNIKTCFLNFLKNIKNALYIYGFEVFREQII